MKIRNKNKIFFTILLLSMLLSLVLMPTLAFAQEEEEEDIAIVESIKFDSTFPELMSKGGVPFNFNIDLTYQGIEEKVFSLKSEQPDSWFVAIQPAYEQVEISAIKLAPGKKETLKITAVPLVSMEPGEYDIKVIAGDDEGLEAVIELKATITSTYEHTMTTATGRLDTKVTAGKDNNYTIKLENTGSAAIENLSLTATAPEGWRIRFTPEKIETFNAGETQDVNVLIYPPEKTIAGDYSVAIRSASENSNKSIDLRVTVLTPTIWGWVGIAIIVIVIVGIAIIFAKLGRR